MAIRFEIIEDTDKVSWLTAQQRAVSKGGRLAVLNTPEKHDAAVSALKSYEGKKIYRLQIPSELDLVSHSWLPKKTVELFGNGRYSDEYRLKVWSVLFDVADEGGMIGDRQWGGNSSQTHRYFINEALRNFFSSDYPAEGLDITEDQYNTLFNYKFGIQSVGNSASNFQYPDLTLQQFISFDGLLAGYPSVWIGLTDSRTEDEWKWVDGSVLTDGIYSEYWAGNSDLSGGNEKEPNNRGATGEDYALILGSDRSQPGMYADTGEGLDGVVLSGRYGYLVEYSITQDDVNPDSPNDFVPEDAADDPVFDQQVNFDLVHSRITDYIPYADFKDYGISLGDTFDTWRKKTNGITKHLLDGTGSFAYCVLQRSLTSPYQWGVTANPSDKRNIQSATFTGNASRLSIQFEKDRSHNDHIVILTVGRTSGGKDLSLYNSYGAAKVAASELTSLWTDSYTKGGFDIGSNVPNGIKINIDNLYYVNSFGSVFASTDPDAYFDKISLVVF